jgi:hypothetical protein
MTTSITKRFEEMIAEDARRTAGEWLDIGTDGAKAMLQMTLDAMRNGELLPEPAEMARDGLRSYLTDDEVEIAWPIFIRKLSNTLRLV